MHIIVIILKIIGMILLFLLALLLFLLVLFLFVPVRYETKGSYKDKKPDLQGRVRYLFPFLQLRFCYGETKLVQLRVFGILIKDFLAPPKKRTSRKKRTKGHTESEKAQYSNARDTKTLPERNETDSVLPSKQAEFTQNDTGQKQDESEKEEKLSFTWRINELIEKIKNLITSLLQMCGNIVQKWKETRKNAEMRKEQILSYLTFLQREDVRKALSIAKITLRRVLKSIAPRKLRIRLHLGLGDPASTGQLCGFYGMIYPFIGNYVIIEPDFVQVVYEGDFYLRGKVTLFVLVKAGCIFLFHKDLKCIRNLILHKEVADE